MSQVKPNVILLPKAAAEMAMFTRMIKEVMMKEGTAKLGDIVTDLLHEQPLHGGVHPIRPAEHG